jgi:hypothetical protein
MAGIHVSGGVFSGSGDLTAEWFWAEYNTSPGGRVFLPNGKFLLTGERSDMAYSYEWQGSSDYLSHCSGTVEITHGGGTRVDAGNGAAAVNATTGRDGQLYNLIINQNSNPRRTDAVQLITRAVSANYLVVENELHIISGTARIGDTTTTNYSKFGHVFIGASGTFSAGDVTDVNKAGWNNWDSSGSIFMKTVIFSGTNSVFVGNGGTITLTGPYAGNGSDHYVWENPTLGTYYHNNGTIQLGGGTVYGPGETSEYDSYMNWKNIDRPADDDSQTSRGDGGWFYNVSGGFRDQGSGDRHLGVQVVGSTAMKVANNFSLMSGASIDSSTYNITISGTLFLDEDAYWGNYATQGGTKTIGALSMANGGNYFKAPTGSLTINNQTSDSYKFKIADNGTFVHNDGTIVLDASTNGGSYINTGSNGKWLYNLTVKNDTTSARAVQHQYGVTIANDLIVSGGGSTAASWDVGFYNAGDGDITASGTATVISGAKLGRSIQNGTFGALTIGTKGWYDAGPTTLVGSAGIPAIFSNSDTFTHNDGTVTLEYGSGGDTKITGSARTTFHKLNTGFSYMHIGFNVEDTWATTGDGGGATNFYDASDNWVIGTTSGTGYLVTNVGTGVKAALNATVSGASEAYPAVVSGTKYDFHIRTNTLNNVDFKDAQTSDDDATLVLSNVDFSSGLTTNDSTTQTLTVTSGTWVKYGGNFVPGDGTKEIVSGATVIFDGAGNYLQDNSATNYGRNSASLWWNSTGYYSPNGGYLNNGWENVFWNADARINQDAVFRNSNLIVGKTFNASNRPIGSTSETQMLKSIKITNGGLLSSSTNTFRIQNTGTFNTRGGFFTSSSAFAFASSSASLIDCGNGSSIANIFDGGGTVEVWVKSNGDGASGSPRIFQKNNDWRVFSDNGTASKLEFTQYFATGKYQYATTDRVITNGEWHHIAMTYDNSSSGNRAIVYVDGQSVRLDTAVATASGTRTDDSSVDLIIGNRAAGDKTWDGDIAMVRFWGDVRSAAEIRTDMFNQYSDMIDKTNLMAMWQFDEGEGTTLTDVSTSGNTGTITIGTSAWATAGNWNANTLSGAAHTGKLYIGTGADPTVFSNSTFELANRELISGSKFASKAHKGTDEYYIATSGANDYLNYTKLSGAPIGVASEVKVLADGSDRSYFSFDSTANNEQCHTLVNAGYVRIVNNSDFYTQDFDNSQGVWVRDSTYGGTIHDDGSTPHEYEPIDIIDDIDSPFDREELLD